MLVRELDRRIAVLERQSRVDKGRTGERRLLQSLIVAWFATLPMPDATTTYGRRQIARMLEVYDEPPAERDDNIGVEADFDGTPDQIGRASCRERWRQNG